MVDAGTFEVYYATVMERHLTRPAVTTSAEQIKQLHVLAFSTIASLPVSHEQKLGLRVGYLESIGSDQPTIAKLTGLTNEGIRYFRLRLERDLSIPYFHYIRTLADRQELIYKRRREARMPANPPNHTHVYVSQEMAARNKAILYLMSIHPRKHTSDVLALLVKELDIQTGQAQLSLTMLIEQEKIDQQNRVVDTFAEIMIPAPKLPSGIASVDQYLALKSQDDLQWAERHSKQFDMVRYSIQTLVARRLAMNDLKQLYPEITPAVLGEHLDVSETVVQQDLATKPPPKNKRPTPEEYAATLEYTLQLRKDGVPLSKMATAMGRDVSSIKNYLKTLAKQGLITYGDIQPDTNSQSKTR